MPVLDDAGRTGGAGCRGVHHRNAARGRGSRPWSDDLSLTRREIDRERERGVAPEDSFIIRRRRRRKKKVADNRVLYTQRLVFRDHQIRRLPKDSELLTRESSVHCWMVYVTGTYNDKHAEAG